jgi:hypothetical protein
MVARLAVIQWPIGRPRRARIKLSAETDSREESMTAVPLAIGKREAWVTAAALVSGSRQG